MPRLVVHKGVAAGQDKALGGECVVGRHPAADFVLDDKLASRRHFRVYPFQGSWVVEDLGSTNGTTVNGQRIQRVGLRDGDLIGVGTSELKFVQKDLLGQSTSAAPPVVPTPPSPPTPAPPAPSRPAAPRARRRRRR